MFLISLTAGGVGLNLTAADYVIHMDPWWNPAVEDQASDRAHRIGQTRPVTIYRLVTKGTIEEQIVDLHHRKRDLAERLLEAGDTRPASTPPNCSPCSATPPPDLAGTPTDQLPEPDLAIVRRLGREYRDHHPIRTTSCGSSSIRTRV